MESSWKEAEDGKSIDAKFWMHLYGQEAITGKNDFNFTVKMTNYTVKMTNFTVKYVQSDRQAHFISTVKEQLSVYSQWKSPSTVYTYDRFS